MDAKKQLEAIRTIAESINKRRRTELMQIYTEDNPYMKYIKELKAKQVNKKRAGNLKRVASYPIEIDKFFTKLYGPDYYKDPDFFNRIAPEWKVTTN